MRECGDPVLDLPHPVLLRDDPAAGRRARALPRRARGRRGVRLAAARVGRGQQPRLRRRRPHPDLRGARRRGGPARARRRRARARAWASCSTSCRTTSASTSRRRTRGGGTCSRTAEASRYASYFDIDWDARARSCSRSSARADPRRGEGARRASTLSDDGTELRYYEHAFPVAPGTATAADSAAGGARAPALPADSWKRGAAELTYRRFFDVSTLAAVRVEDPEVFAATHGEVLRWVEAGEVDGLRVDHPDGLSDPGGYARRLRAAIGPDRWLLVEKILGVGEELPVSWPVDGTSGYEALREICGVFVDADGAGLLTQLTAEHTRAQGERARGRARGPPGGGRHDPGGRGAPDRGAGAGGPDGRRPGAGGGGGRRRAAVRLPGVPQLPARGALGAGDRGVGRARAPAGPGGGAGDDPRHDARRPRRRAGHPGAADVGHGDGQGRRGHRVLPLQPARRAERGGRRPGPVRRLPRRVPRPQRRRGWRRGRAP